MERQDGKPFDVFGAIKSWVRWRPESSANISTDFWMPDHSCRVCYECDAQFTVFNRRHHCRLCGRIFCAKCTANSVPACAVGASTVWNEWEKVRVCNYCFNQWELGVARFGDDQPDDTGTPSASSIASTKSSGPTSDSTISICSMSFGIVEQTSDNCSLSPYQSTMMDHQSGEIQGMEGSGRSNVSFPYAEKSSMDKFRSGTNSFRSDDEYDDLFGVVYQFGPKTRNYPQDDDFYGPMKIDGISNAYDSHTFVSDVDNTGTKSLTSSTFPDKFDEQDAEFHQVGKKEDHYIGDDCEAPSSLCAAEDVDTEPVDFENNGLFWLPPEPENEEDDRETSLFDDDDDDGVDTGEWGRLKTSDSFGSGEFCIRDKSGDEQKKMMKNIVYGHFRALVSQLLQVENIPISDDDDGKDSWLEIITALSWEAATLLKPDMSKGGGMDPGGYVKVKCIASGCRSESVVIKGVVCKKNVAHRRMASRIDKPRIMILGGALEYQRVSNLLSSFHTLLQQEMDHLKMAVAKIDAHRPNVLLVEKSVSRYAQEYILAKDISLVLNIKRPLLECIARCTGAQIVPSIDHLTTQKMGHCDLFHVDKCFESHGSAGQAGKKLTKTLMYFEGCPKPLGCTILLRGANGDELRKVKHVVQYGIFAAYHLAVETSFLADEGASLPDHLLSEPITVAFPNKSSIDRSISVVPGFTIPTHEKSVGEPRSAHAVGDPLASAFASNQTDMTRSISLPIVTSDADVVSSSFTNKISVNDLASETSYDEVSRVCATKENHIGDATLQDASATNDVEPCLQNYPQTDDGCPSKEKEHESISDNACQQDANTIQEVPGPAKEEFPPSPSDLQSILVSLSSRCVWKGTVCERAHLFRIKYYGSFDKPVGRFLQDHLFDQSYRCRTCDMPSEAHVQCYTHRQGTLTISVKKLSEILLPGEREGKIWMWHRCLRCPRLSGFPPATRRVVMSDAAWGLSFGKFLELSFSNHAAASRVASCGHSLHRDCLRFYGCGKMVACFRYASIDVYSVYLPPSKVEFNYEIQDWIQKEAKQVVRQAGLLFSEVLNAIAQITKKKNDEAVSNTGVTLPESRHRITDLKKILQNEKTEFEEIHWKTLNKEVKKGHPAIDILEVNRLRRQLLFQSYMWDHRLILADSLDKISHHTDNSDKINHHGDNASSRLNSHERSISTSYFMLPSFIPSNPLVGDEPSQPSSNPCKCSYLEGEFKEDVKIKTVPSQDISSNKENQHDSSVSFEFAENSDPFECGSTVRRALSDSHFLHFSDTLDAAWSGKNQPGVRNFSLMGSVSVDSSLASAAERFALENPVEERSGSRSALSPSLAPTLNVKGSDNTNDEAVRRLGMPFLNFYRSLNKNFLKNAQRLDTFCGYNPVYVSAPELVFQGGAKWLLPVGVNDYVIPVYDDEPTSIISYALVSQDYHVQISNDGDRQKETLESTASLPLQESSSFLSLDETMTEPHRSLSVDETILSTSTLAQHLINSKSLHIRVSFTDSGSVDKAKYTVTCYYAKHFDALRKICCPSEVDYVRSLSRCKKWGAQGGKSNVFFAKTLDDRFIIKQVTKTELESFIKFAPEYFKYLTEAISTKSPTCLAKILGIYQVTIKHVKGGKDSKMDVLVMENLLFKRNVTRLYDLKGSSRSRYNPDSSGSNKVLLDQNLIEAMPTSPIFVGNKAKRLLERAVWNDTAFLASVDVMDYSLLVGVDGENHELVLGIIDFMRQYTWDKHLETWVKASGILGGPKNVSPTVISPKQYKKRFRKAMTTYFLMVPDQWSSPSVIPSKEKTNSSEENAQCISSHDRNEGTL